MSSMLEQAIVDAEQLKETAKKTAEEGVVEKYQDEIKEAIEKILEQDEGAEAEMTATPEGELELVDELPAAQTADKEEVVEINLNQLEEMMAQELEEEGLKAEDMLSREQIAEELEEIADEGKEVDLDENDLLELAEEDEEVDINETNLAAVIAEMLGADDESEEDDSDEEEVVEEAVEEETEDDTTDLEETNVALTQEAKSLVKENKSLLKEQTRTEKKVKLLKEKVYK